MHTWYVPHPYGIFPKGNRALSVAAAATAAPSSTTTRSRRSDARGAAAEGTGDAASGACSRRPRRALDEAVAETLDEEHARRLGNAFSRFFASPHVADEAAALDLLFTSLEFLDPPALCQLAAVSTAWFALASNSEPWKRLFHCFAAPEHSTNPTCAHRPLQYAVNWKTTVVRQFGSDGTGRVGHGSSRAPFTHTPLRFPGRPLYNDTLFQAWLCTIMPPTFMLRQERSTTGARPATAAATAAVAAPPGTIGSGVGMAEAETRVAEAAVAAAASALRDSQWEGPAAADAANDSEGDECDSTGSSAAAQGAATRGVGSSRSGSANSGTSTEASHATAAALLHNKLLPQFRSKFNSVSRVFRPSLDEFRERFELPNIPCIVTGVATEWQLFHELAGDFRNLGRKASALFPHRQRRQQGSDVSNASMSPEPTFRCESVDMTAPGYVSYAAQQCDERPLYLFDAEFAASMDGAGSTMWSVPAIFERDDLFSVLGAARPKFRWLIAGPARGGSSFHVDPNFTTAWNACLTGRKRWLLFPPQHIPPGVYPSADMRDVTTPVSITEWFLNFYEEAVARLAHVGYEVICDPGEIMFVPYGWWHLVINLEDSVALTQNYVSKCNLHKVLRFLKHMPQSISGIDEDADNMNAAEIDRRRRGFFDVFVQSLRAHPEKISTGELDELLQEIDQEEHVRKRKRVERDAQPKVQMLEGEEQATGFAFSF